MICCLCRHLVTSAFIMRRHWNGNWSCKDKAEPFPKISVFMFGVIKQCIPPPVFHYTCGGSRRNSSGLGPPQARDSLQLLREQVCVDTYRLCVYMFICLYEYVYICICLYVYISVYVYMFIYVYVYMCMYIICECSDFFSNLYIHNFNIFPSFCVIS